MSNKHIADGESAFSAVSSTPDCCEVGSTVVPFDSYQSLDKLKVHAKSVSARGKPVLTVGSVVAGTQGNAGAGVVSGTSLGSGDCEITSGSPTVSVEGKPVARHGSDVAMNNNNCQGKLITATGSPSGRMLYSRIPCNNPPLSSPLLEWLKETKAEYATLSENLTKARETIDFGDAVDAADKWAAEKIDTLRPTEKIERPGPVADYLNQKQALKSGVTRAILGFGRSVLSGVANLVNWGVQGATQGVSDLVDPVSYLDSAILAEELRLGNICWEWMVEEAKNSLETTRQATMDTMEQIWNETADKWEQGGIGDKAEITTRAVIELGTLPLVPLKAGQVGKVGQVAKLGETAADAAKIAKKARGSDGVHVKGFASRAAFGERRAHEVMKAKGMQPMGKTDGIYHPGRTGIDGIYKNPTPPPDYIITEAKYNTSKLNKGLADGTNQMDDKWVKRRLDNHLSPEEAANIKRAMRYPGAVDKWKIQVRPDGSIHINKIDSDGNIIRGKAGKID